MLLSFLLLLLAQDVAPPAPNTVAADLPAAIQLVQEGRDAEALAAHCFEEARRAETGEIGRASCRERV